MGKKAAPHRSGWLIAAVIALALIVAALAVIYVPWTHWLGALRSQIRHSGSLGPLLFALAYVAAEMLMAPATPLTILGAVIFGFWALPLVLASAMTAATVSFFLARYLLRDRVKRWMEKRKELPAVDRALRDGGWKSVALVTLSPLIPFSLQNYMLGTTRVHVGPFLVGTFLGILPSTFLCVYVGAAGRHMHLDNSPLQWGLLALGLAATVALSVWMTRKAKHQLG